ncbi:MAG: hypothetical protein J6N49_06600 [Alphaproteobacteria bacterium]|nr:hypothetical protein [Alphaproteobacteria bacterium]
MMNLKTYLLIATLLMPIQAHAIKNIPIAPMEEFSGLSRTAILDKRMAAVKESIFNEMQPYYSPSSSVFQIEDGLPWISAYEVTCYGKGIKGPSRESFAILNPPILYYPLMAMYNFSENYGCSEVDYLLVNRLTYNESQKRITAHIDYTSFYKKNKLFYKIHLSDTNARDLGYNYVYAPLAENIRFKSADNISTDIVPTRGFYHRGSSCGEPGGCNNYSPYQPELEFYITALPAEIKFKLWKYQPLKKEDNADITYRLIFE